MEQGDGSLRYKLYEVIAGGLIKISLPGSKHRQGFDSLDDATNYINDLDFQRRRKEEISGRKSSRKQIVIQEYTDNYIAKIVKIIEL